MPYKTRLGHAAWNVIYTDRDVEREARAFDIPAEALRARVKELQEAPNESDFY